jgi:NAD(P)H-quinone oxidoreductase subunit 4
VRQAYTNIAQVNPNIYGSGFLVPQVAESEVVPVLGIVK